ncbi:MAG: hypothetical protein NUV52_04610 [Candidatus Roizmanbacteria bacterium]|nr:hypothetical protein [Candidatus Roizmanbacteria bacterium]
MFLEHSPQPYIINGSTPERESLPVPFMLLSKGSRRPLSTKDVLPFHIPQDLKEKIGLEAFTISFLSQGFPTFYSYEKPVSPVAYMTIRTHASQLALNWGQYLNTVTHEYSMHIPALPTLLKRDHEGNLWLWDKTSGLYFNPSLTSFIGQGWELVFTGGNKI